MEQGRALTLIHGFTRAVEAVVGHANFVVLAPTGPNPDDEAIVRAYLPARRGIARAEVEVTLADLDDATFGEDCLARDIAALFGHKLHDPAHLREWAVSVLKSVLADRVDDEGEPLRFADLVIHNRESYPVPATAPDAATWRPLVYDRPAGKTIPHEALAFAHRHGRNDIARHLFERALDL